MLNIFLKVLMRIYIVNLFRVKEQTWSRVSPLYPRRKSRSKRFSKKKFVVNRVWMAVEEVSIVHSLKRNLPGNFRIEFYEYVLNASRVREARFDAALSACKGG